ncbi:MAG: putative esterase [Verrucomicrobiaceae bacterium]|nr:putative esterase [Verrucomicrobiaceae bacterium]
MLSKPENSRSLQHCALSSVMRGLLNLAIFCLVSCNKPIQAEDNETVTSPIVAADHHVEFRLEAPLAKSVKLRGVQRQVVEMKKDAKGVWFVSVGPLPPGIYGYSFIVDGEAMLDPSNPEIKPERDPDESELEVVTNPPLLTQWQDIPHGTVHLHDYFSKPLKRLRHLRVYTPPGYEADPSGTRFPVLYLMHGTGDTEATWTEFGRAHFIEDNLLATSKALPVIIVMTDGHADLADEEGIGPRNLEKMESDLLQSVIPLVDKVYRTKSEPNHRAICGLSMGGFQSMFTGLRHLETFAWVCGMSAYVPDVETTCAAALNDPATNSRLKLFWHRMGKDDFLLPKQKVFEAALEKHGLKRQFAITAGDHSWPVWRGYLGELLPVLFRF